MNSYVYRYVPSALGLPLPTHLVATEPAEFSKALGQGLHLATQVYMGILLTPNSPTLHVHTFVPFGLSSLFLP